MKFAASLVLVAVALSVAEISHAEIGDWLQNNEQQAKQLFDRGQYDEAARRFEDPYRRGVAHYRSGDYPAAEKDFEQVDRAEVKRDADFNLGNTRFQLQDYEGAVHAYLRVLEEDPQDTGARHNLGVAKAMLAKVEPEKLVKIEQEEARRKQQSEQQKSEQEQEQQASQSEQQQSEQEQEQQESQSEQQQSEQQQSGDQQQEQQASQSEQQQSEQQQSGD
ncbi:MAG: tetratricopeptide repeat protein, partial [Gammaproteobacteria bacterium]|nr:tetratricopeptide repeat protein [Gammaproteobacteria bacterium]